MILILFLSGLQDVRSRGFNEGVEHEMFIPDFDFKHIEAAGRNFMMGSPLIDVVRAGNGRIENGNPVEVVFTRDFAIMTKEVTQKQWFDVMGNNPSSFNTKRYCRDYIRRQTLAGVVDICSNLPVVNVSWHDVQEFIEKINNKLGLSDCMGTPKDPMDCLRL
ncbi:MAG: SUMF1/EgtB/PvdO family nonheme iron enzyme, partial [Halobacteriovoraceae bacterium]|nr:SUMF1/EgtB/PvdO family nonheme iron enzyme [Halobacteriovoraceae bacterium]